MQRFSLKQIVFIGADIILFAVSCFHIPSVLERARPPFTVHSDQQSIVIQSVKNVQFAGGLREGDRILSWDTHEIVIPDMLEHFADLSIIGQHAEIGFIRDAAQQTATIELLAYYESPRFVFVTFCIGIITWFVAVFILMSKGKSAAADLLHWALISLAISVMTTWGAVDRNSLFSMGSRLLFFVSYAFTPALFLIFSGIYPIPKKGTVRKMFFLLLPIALLIAAGQGVFYLRAVVGDPVLNGHIFQQWYSVFNIYLILCYIVMVSTLLHSYRHAVRIDDKRKLEWILWGFCASPVPFLLLIKFPQLFGVSAGLIDEEITTVFLLLIPFSCAISLVRYTFADIRFVINRSIVYAFLSFIAGVIFFLTVLLAATSVDPEAVFREYFLIGSIIITVIIVLNPIRKRIQHLLDELLFPARVTFHRTISEIRERLRLCLSAEDVFQTVTERLPKTISLSSLRMYKRSSNVLQLMSSSNGSAHDTIPLRHEDGLLFEQNAVIASSSAISFRRGDILLDHAVLTRLFDCTVCVPLCSESGDLLAIAAANPSTTSGRLTEEEIDLMLTICKDAARELERLSVQKQMFIQKQETARLNELNTLKSFFVSSVSHELRTPLTSIRMFAEILRMQRTLPEKKQTEYLQIIEGESDRLTRLVENVLDFAAIERGGKEYHCDQINFPDVVRRAAKTMHYQFKKQGARLRVEIPKQKVLLYADGDALEEVCINLLSNALKYSPKKTTVRIRVVKEPNGARLEVSDKGIGIPEKEIDHIFEHFYRVRDPRLRHAGGTGLGLALVKHIVEAHSGTITVQSIVGKGTTFIIKLPLPKKGRT